jgi:acyl homoserine lactone synthase
MIECVCLKNNHQFEGNPLYSQHQLRYKSIIERQKWDVPTIEDAEYDSYDNPAAYYLIKRDNSGAALGVSRLYPTDRPYMLKESFSHMVTNMDMPSNSTVWEGSRFCIEKNLEPDLRKKIIQEIVVGYLEFALERNISKIIGVMFPAYWRGVFSNSGWDVEWMGDIHKSAEGHKIRAGCLNISQRTLFNVRKITGINYPVLNNGSDKYQKIAA